MCLLNDLLKLYEKKNAYNFYALENVININDIIIYTLVHLLYMVTTTQK